MPIQEIRIFISAPDDVQEERQKLKALIEDDLQKTIGEREDLYLVSVTWGDVGPTMAENSEKLLDKLGEFDIFVGVFWHSFGKSTGAVSYDPELEFRRAYEKWENDGRLPILIYFRKGSPDNLDEIDTDQLSKVRTFREELEQKGSIEQYREVDEFVKLVRKDLYNEISDICDRKEVEAKKNKELSEKISSFSQETSQEFSIKGDLLVHMLDRTPLYERLKDLIDNQHASEKPVVCIVHGDSNQCIGDLIKRIRDVDLPKLWNLDPVRDKVNELRFIWPAAPKKISDFHGQLTSALSRTIMPNFSSTEDVANYINEMNTPVLIRGDFSASYWERYGKKAIMKEFLDYWVKVKPISQRVVVLLSIRYKSKTQSKGIFSFMGLSKKKESPYEHIERALEELNAPPCQSLIFSVFSKLPNITPEDVEQWALAYCEKEVGDAQMDELFKTEEEKEIGIPMDEIVKRIDPMMSAFKPPVNNE